MTRAPLVGLTLALSLAACGKSSNEAATTVQNNVTAAAENAANATATNTVANNATAAAPVDVSKWENLDKAVGRYPADVQLYENSAIAVSLKELLGDDFDDFVENMRVSGPISEDGVLYVTGNKPHEGGSDAAYLLIEPVKRQLEVGIWEDGKFKAYNTPGALLIRPDNVRQMITNMRTEPKT